MKRVSFIKSLSAVSAGALLLPGSSSLAAFRTIEEVIKPPSIKPGDTIGLIAPGSFISSEELNESVNNLETLGFKPFYTDTILARNGYLGGTDKQRADDIHTMFQNKDVKGIVCARGGYGCSRLLPMLNYDLIKSNPKVLSGYSDITSLLYGIYAKTGLVCFHGPVAISTFNEFSVNFFRNTVTYPSEKLIMYNADEEKNGDNKSYTLRQGKAQGKLTGGNLSILVSLIGTPFDIDSTDKIIFIEEIGEEPYRIDRMLTQMIQSGKFDKAAGIAIGSFKNCEAKPDKSGISNSFTLAEVLYDRLYALGIPVVYGMSFGHITNKFTLPIGIKAELDADLQTLTLLENAVI